MKEVHSPKGFESRCYSRCCLSPVHTLFFPLQRWQAWFQLPAPHFVTWRLSLALQPPLCHLRSRPKCQGIDTPGAASQQRWTGVGVYIPQLPSPSGRTTLRCVFYIGFQSFLSRYKLQSPTVVASLISHALCFLGCPPFPVFLLHAPASISWHLLPDKLLHLESLP